MSKNTVVLEFANTLSEEDLLFVTSRLSDRMTGDLAEAVDFLSKDKQMDLLLSSAQSGDEFFETCDQIRDLFQKECKRRFSKGRTTAA